MLLLREWLMAHPGTISQTAEEPAKLPLLESGDRLQGPEFERRYVAMPELKKAELIEGEVYIPSPVRWNQHAGPHADFIGWLVFFRAHTPGVRVGDNGSIRLDMGNEPQAGAASSVG